jgi:hypothetical protein
MFHSFDTFHILIRNSTNLILRFLDLLPVSRAEKDKTSGLIHLQKSTKSSMLSEIDFGLVVEVKMDEIKVRYQGKGLILECVTPSLSTPTFKRTGAFEFVGLKSDEWKCFSNTDVKLQKTFADAEFDEFGLKLYLA